MEIISVRDPTIKDLDKSILTPIYFCVVKLVNDIEYLLLKVNTIVHFSDECIIEIETMAAL